MSMIKTIPRTPVLPWASSWLFTYRVCFGTSQHVFGKENEHVLDNPQLGPGKRRSCWKNHSTLLIHCILVGTIICLSEIPLRDSDFDMKLIYPQHRRSCSWMSQHCSTLLCTVVLLHVYHARPGSTVQEVKKYCKVVGFGFGVALSYFSLGAAPSRLLALAWPGSGPFFVSVSGVTVPAEFGCRVPCGPSRKDFTFTFTFLAWFGIYVYHISYIIYYTGHTWI